MGLGLTIVYQFAASSEVTGLSENIAFALTNFFSGIGVFLGPVSLVSIYSVSAHLRVSTSPNKSSTIAAQVIPLKVIHYTRRSTVYSKNKSFFFSG